MYITTSIFLGILGHLSTGVPLEEPSADLSHFFKGQPIIGDPQPVLNNQRIFGDPGGFFSDRRIAGGSEGVFNNQRIVGDYERVFNDQKILGDSEEDFNDQGFVGDAQAVINDERIVGGSQSEEGSAPHMTGLVVGFNWRSFICGGSIISQRHILTAAHCITGLINWNGHLLDTFHAVIGSTTWYKGKIVYLKDYRIHHDYDSILIKNDIGILITHFNIQLDETAAIIALNFNFIEGREKSYVTGWGTEWLWGNLPSKLKILIVDTISHAECERGIIAAAESWGGWAPPVEKLFEICTFHSPGNGMCHGDSGSALVRIACGTQIGIVSWGVPCARGGPDVFVRVGFYGDWIKNVLKIY